MEKIELKLDESNELTFKLMIEGTREPATAIRFVCEADDNMSYMFKCETTDEPGEIRVTIPPMRDQLKEGIYESRLEVVIEGKYLAPLNVMSQFKSGVRVVAESIRRTEVVIPQPGIKAAVTSAVSVTQKKQHVKPILVSESSPKPITLADKYKSKK